MAAKRVTITVDPNLYESIRDASEYERVSVSSFLANAAAAHVRNSLLGRALDEWEAEDGPITEEELDDAARLLGWTRTRRGDAA